MGRWGGFEFVLVLTHVLDFPFVSRTTDENEDEDEFQNTRFRPPLLRLLPFLLEGVTKAKM